MEAISVPFRWEDKPGTPKRDTAPTNPPSTPLFPLPPPPGGRLPLRPPLTPLPPPQIPATNYVVSIPFKWEEKPGTPLQQPHFFECFDSDQESSLGEEPDTLLANRLMPASAISAAVPYESEAPSFSCSSSSPESTASSDATGDSQSFLEQLFPLTTPKAASEIHQVKELGGEDAMITRTPTLGELIMMSRRRSCLQLDVEPPKDLGCCAFGAPNRGIEKLLRGKSGLLMMLKFA